jgi:hypothetical protein
MKTTLTTYQAADLLVRDEYANWSIAGASALAKHFEQIEEETGEEIDFNATEIRCDWSEYESLQDAAEDHGWDPSSHIEDDGNECDADALQWLESRCKVIEFDGGVIISNFR